jgi:phospholipid/cholesterol/gamma-HCH transport system substrate-binding protein
MDIHFKRMEKIVGTFVLCIAILLLAVIISIGRGKDWFQRYVTYYTMFNENYNLQDNTPVKLFKADIGKVKKITLVGDKVKVRLAIREEYASRIRSDSFAVVESPTLIGSEYVSIRPGNPDLPQIPEDGMIPGKATRSLSEVITQFELEKTAKMLIQAVQGLSDFVQTLRDPQGILFSTLHHLEQTTSHIEMIARNFREGKGSLGGLLTTDTLIESIQDKLNAMERILQHMETAAAQTPRVMDQIHDDLASIHQVISGANQSVDQISGILVKVDDSVNTVHNILKNMEKGSEDVPGITTSAMEGIQDIRDSLDEIDRVVQSLQKNILIRSNLPLKPEGHLQDSGLRR